MRYPSDLTEAQWELIKDFFPSGNRSKYDKRALINAVFYVVKTGCQWRMLPSNFPPYATVFSFFRRARLKGVWEAVMQALVKEDRVRSGKAAEPTYGMIDSQSVKTTGASEKRGIDGGKKNQGT